MDPDTSGPSPAALSGRGVSRNLEDPRDTLRVQRQPIGSRSLDRQLAGDVQLPHGHIDCLWTHKRPGRIERDRVESHEAVGPIDGFAEA